MGKHKHIQQSPSRWTIVPESCNVVRSYSIVAGRRETTQRKTKAVTEGDTSGGGSEGD